MRSPLAGANSGGARSVWIASTVTAYRLSSIGCVLTAAFFARAIDAQEVSNPTYWQLKLAYTRDELALLDATPIEPIAKTLTQPGLRGAAATCEAELDWFNAYDEVVATTEIVFPFGTRVAPIPGAACETLVPDDGIIVVRVIGPDASTDPTHVRIRPTASKSNTDSLPLVPEVFRGESIIPIEQIGTAGAKVGPIDAEKTLDSGPDSNRLVLVVVGDGYRNTELQSGAFELHTDGLVAAFQNKAPWDTYFDLTNVYRIDTSSAQSGADRIDNSNGPLVDTYYNSTFWSFGIERLLTIDTLGQSRAIDAADDLVGAGVWDYIFVLVNSDKYGGSGGPIAVSSVHSAASEIILHEFGHSYAGLADEYESSVPGTFRQDPEPNVDVDSSLQLIKWRHWIETGTPIPTPETAQYDSVVGVFQGARYFATGLYRPWLACLMRDLGEPFCPVCAEEHTISFFDHVKLIDGSSHAAGAHIVVPLGGVNVSVTPVGLAGLSYQWRINGNLVSGASGPTLALLPAMVPAGTNTLQVELTHPTSLVRKQTISNLRSWTIESSATVNNDTCATASPIVLGVPFDGSTTGAGTSAAVCGTLDRKDVWHNFTALTDGEVRFTTCLGVSFNTTLAVYGSCGGALIACNDDFCGTASEVEIPVLAGETYYIRIAGVSNTTGSYTLLAEDISPEPFCRDGDVNGDCQVTPADAALLFEQFTGETSITLEQQYRGDTFEPQSPPFITPNDSQCIFRYYLGDPRSCIEEFPSDCSCAR